MPSTPLSAGRARTAKLAIGFHDLNVMVRPANPHRRIVPGAYLLPRRRFDRIPDRTTAHNEPTGD